MNYFERKKRWEAIQSKGFLRFLLFYGIVVAAGGSFVLSILESVFFRWRWDLVHEIVWSLILGILLSVMMWATGKARFR